MAVAAHAGSPIATVKVMFGRPVDVIGDDEVESSVVVVIEPRSARSPPAEILHTRPCADIGEGTIAIVVVEDGTAVAEHEQVRKAVVVVVTHGHSHSEKTLRRNSGF